LYRYFILITIYIIKMQFFK